ncbi:MAG: amidophosphoribosyltransferase [Omnitrophica bacterium RIFCSPLOWO2_12_FULL_44_17]|uniref:Amidophosphoribosyltransferase n=1 Tax=Candidatus Danuiimicrobium aquiferis TaxID=1801832 RepID=A0A1G1KWJ5_9BACT|nr:MAG: amidophosphoribosyltransferase [Omnitrophica bacterium RIFCSPHIGHO2_02_FULL_45_28]OGW90266.1 MAG: amidophosphoribosyltransferase [Omnitrophica bacterium RIFCSPHIGHO2_12_FULL_44_12]OGW97245.1 MAG: amidophosphoribosyltransferase [Omnitrophica bacterium RIFCSPLOWO2_12_FULL_44_17]OGX02300.1 MAG: amidophosphoribosyltransferase [Omnitrophica bacterium RIFCSPLOWO2_02_FULL_44_11]
MNNGPKHYCGVFGIYGHENAAQLTYLGLFALQHRGEESAGIAASDGKSIQLHKAMGLVGDAIPAGMLAKLNGKLAIGHVRYSTTGSTSLANAQPLMVDYSRGQLAIAHNGNLTNAQFLRAELEAYGSIFTSTTDSEIFIHLMAKPQYKNTVESVLGAVKQMQGAFTMTVLTETELFGIRDPQGFRPLCLGKFNGGYVLASETCAFDLIEAEYIRDVEPGEVVRISDDGVQSFYPFKGQEQRIAQCIFEHVYFARPDSKVFGENVGLVRERMGRILAKEHPVAADIVVSVPDSGNFSAMGYSKESGIPLAHGFIRNHYIGRTFINPKKEDRTFKVKIKLNPIQEIVSGKRIIVVDDSVVRGNTSKSRVKLLRKAGAKEVHLRISCPPHISPCFYGIDFPSREELLAYNQSMEYIRKFLDVDTIGYLSHEGLLASVSKPKGNYCTACFTGNYPTKILDVTDKFKLEQRWERGIKN